MARSTVILLTAALLAASFTGYVLLTNMAARRGPKAVVYAAPTLAKLAQDLAKLANADADIRRIGSLAALRLIEQGNIPDAYFSVELELASHIKPRQLIQLGTYELRLLCRGGAGIGALRDGRIAVANPNLAPIGYRSLTALYVLSQRGFLDLADVERALNVTYESLPNGTVLIDVTHITSSGRFLLRGNIEEAATLVEQGIADCTFAYMPFILSRNYSSGFAIIALPDDLKFTSDPPGHFVAKLTSGYVAIGKEGAFAASFTEAGDYLLSFLRELNLTSYGLIGS